MTVLSAQTIRCLKLIEPCHMPYTDVHGNSAGLSACGYDLTLAQSVRIKSGGFLLASTAERFYLPHDVVGIIHDKSSLARRGLVVQNTVAEPGWRGYLTLELTNHSPEELFFAQWAAICQVVFHLLDQPTILPYKGKYQDQPQEPVPARATYVFP